MRLLLIALLVSATTPCLAQRSSRGEQLFDAHDRAAARVEFSSALHRNAQDATAHYYLGRLALIDGDVDGAVQHLQKAVELRETDSDFHLWYGSALAQQAVRASKLKQGFVARRMKSELERAVALNGTNIEARDILVDFYSMAPGFMGGSIEKARDQARAIARIDAMRGHVALGKVAISTKDSTAVERELNAAIAAAPDSLRAYSALSAWYTRAKKYPQAFATMDRYLAKHPDDPYGQYGFARVASASGQELPRALAGIRAFIANPPKDAGTPVIARAYVRLGTLLDHQAKHDEARAAYQQALKLDPHNDDAKKSLASAR